MFVNDATATVSGRIREAREAAGMTQEDLAREVGATLRSIQWWESGKRPPKLAYVPKLARATGKPVDYFMPEADAA